MFTNRTIMFMIHKENYGADMSCEIKKEHKKKKKKKLKNGVMYLGDFFKTRGVSWA